MESKLNCALLIDDDEATNTVNKMVINQLNCAKQVEVAQNGQEGLDFLKSAVEEKNPKPDLVFLDIMMPGMDGWEFLDEFYKFDKAQLGQMVVVMLTTSIDPKDKEKALKVPYIDRFQTKPLTKPVLKDIIEHHIPAAKISNND